MILPPFSAPRDFKDALHPPNDAEGMWFIFLKDQLLISDDRKNVPLHHDFTFQRTLYLGTLGSQHLFAAEVEPETKAPCGFHWSHLRSLFSILDEEKYAIAGRSLQLIHWDRSNQFCGCCGSSTVLRKHERCRECTACGQLAYPKLSPAVMVLIRRDEKILLARGPHFPGKWYSVLAGFVDPGETLEQCVARETLEEVGIRVKNIQYFGSQPWPFSYSLMIGFTCEWLEGEIQIDPLELEAADWFSASDLPELPPKISLAHMLIDSYLNSQS